MQNDSPVLITREHEICAGHRVYGHEGKCKNLHGHNYRFEITLTANDLDMLGRVIDFAIIKNLLCQWLEDNWDHKMLLWEKDPIQYDLVEIPQESNHDEHAIVSLPFNPTVENIAAYFATAIAPVLLRDTVVKVYSVKVWETAKCSSTFIVERGKNYDKIATRNG